MVNVLKKAHQATMQVAAPAPFLQIPPFPGSNGATLQVPADGVTNPLSDEDVDAALSAIAHFQVGGSYWQAQPALPGRPYTLVRVREAATRRRAQATLPSDEPVVVWTDGDRDGEVDRSSDPWHLLGGAHNVIVDADDQLALLAAIAGLPVTCVGGGPFAGLQQGGSKALRDAFRRCAVEGVRYVDPFTSEPISLRNAIELCGFWRSLIDSNRVFTAAVGFAFWKRTTVAPLLWNGSFPVPFVSRVSPGSLGGAIAVWKTRTDAATLRQLERSGAQLVEVEDGFIRSTGLGADCIPPLSIVVDPLGIYFDPRRPSELERLLAEASFTPKILERARRLRELIVERGIGKYGAGAAQLQRRGARRHVLVPGQVEDDRSVLCGGGEVSTNLELLRRTRSAAPDAYIIYKPHPDVEAGHRRGAIAEKLCLGFGDEIVRHAPISALIDLVDEVHVNTSLAGFEALLRGKPVTTHGVPFYAGWGLTYDLGPVPQRRNRRRSLDELVAAALMLYPRYLDPVTGLPCPPEIVIRRLAEGGADERNGPVVRLRQLQGRLKRIVSRFW